MAAESGASPGRRTWLTVATTPGSVPRVGSIGGA